MTAPSVLYCTDQDVAERCEADFPLLVPKSQVVAKGTDGAFANGSPWVLTSASVNFGTCGVAAGQVVQLAKPGVNPPVWPGTALFAVASVSGSSLTLARLGLSTLAGMPAAPSAGVSGVTFVIATLAQQIALAVDWLNRKFGINDNVPGRQAVLLDDGPGSLRELTVLRVLWLQYHTMSRDAGNAAEHFIAQAKLYNRLFADQLDQVNVRWLQPALPDQSSIFGTKLTR